MRNPERVLSSLAEHSKASNYQFERLYRILFNEEMFYIAYQRISANKGGMTAGVDGTTTDAMSLPRIEKLIDQIILQSNGNNALFLPVDDPLITYLHIPINHHSLL